jgi:hypothetical protein
MELRGATVLLTGATGGIGQALAVELAARGGELVLTGRRADVLTPLAERLGGRAIPADLTYRAAVEKLLDAAGELDVVVANAALPATGLLADYSLDELDRALDVNPRAPIVLAKLAGERMAACRRGHIVFISRCPGRRRSGTRPSTTPPSSGYVASPSHSERTCGPTTSVSPRCSPVSSGTPACSPTPAPPCLRASAPGHRGTWHARPCGPSSATTPRWTWPRSACACWSCWGGAFPRLAAAVQRRVGGDEVTEQLAKGQRHKR